MKRLIASSAMLVWFAQTGFAQKPAPLVASPEETLQLLELSQARNFERTRDSEARSNVEKWEVEKVNKLKLFEVSQLLHSKNAIDKVLLDEAEANYSVIRLKVDQAKAEIDRSVANMAIIDMKKSWLLGGPKDTAQVLALYAQLAKAQCAIKNLTVLIKEVELDYAGKLLQYVRTQREPKFLAMQKEFNAMEAQAAATAELTAAKVEVENCQEIANP